MSIEPISFAEIAATATPQGTVLYGLTAQGAVYEYNFSREVWIPLPMRALPENGSQENIIGLRGRSGICAAG